MMQSRVTNFIFMAPVLDVGRRRLTGLPGTFEIPRRRDITRQFLILDMIDNLKNTESEVHYLCHALSKSARILLKK